MRHDLQLYKSDVGIFIENMHQRIRETIHEQSENYILNVGEEQYILSLESNFLIDIPIIERDGVHVDTDEAYVAGSRFPAEYFVESSSTYREEVIVFNLPYSGDISLLRLRPNPFAYLTPTITIDSSEECIIIEIIKFSQTPDEIKKRYEERLRTVLSNYGALKKNLEGYNSGLKEFIRSSFQIRKDQILKSKAFLSSLGVPLKKSADTPGTFSVAKPKLRKKIVVKPVTHLKDYQPEPTVNEENYHEILKIIDDVGKNFERYPSVYRGKEEEHLRDHILLTLDPNFEFGSASGETFNKTGKTDIQLRYNSSVVFIAECKIWRGEKQFKEGIDQLLSYLTWRDSKTAYIVFVPNKEFSGVLDQIDDLVAGHSNFVQAMPKTYGNWFNYTLNLPVDPNKEIRMGVLLYHIPAVDGLDKKKNKFTKEG